MVKWIGIELWRNGYGETVQRIHTHVHLVKWQDVEIVCCREFKGEIV